MSTPRKRCGECGRSVREEDTALVWGHRSGDYRRSGATAMRRVCRSCVEEQVAFARTGQAEGRQSPLDTHAVQWSQAADALGVDISGLWRNDYHRKRLEEAKAIPGDATTGITAEEPSAGTGPAPKSQAPLP